MNLIPKINIKRKKILIKCIKDINIINFLTPTQISILNNNHGLSIDHEVIKMIKNYIDINKISQYEDKYKDVREYINNIMNYYGYILKDKLIILLNTYNLNLREINILINLKLEYKELLVNNRIYIAKDCLIKKDIQNNRLIKPFNDNNNNTLRLRDMFDKWLKNHLKVSIKDIDDLIINIYLFHDQFNNNTGINYYILKFFPNLNKNQLTIFIHYLKLISNNTPKWYLGGYTPNEDKEVAF